MDLNEIIPTSDTATVEILHPITEEPMVNPDGSPMTITLWNAYSQEYKDIFYATADARLAKAMAENKQVDRLSVKEMEEESLVMLAKITKEWNITLDGETPELTFEKALELYRKIPTLKNQLEKGKAESEAFT